MSYGRIAITIVSLFILMAIGVSGTGCKSTKNLSEGQYLLRSNTIKLKSDRTLTQKGELSDNMSALVVQRPNSYILGLIPFKLWLYNNRYEKYKKDSLNFQLKTKTVEKPVIYDSSSIRKSVLNMKSYLFHEGYFYPQVSDTTIFKGKKAYVTYKVNTGNNYLINKVDLDANDSEVYNILAQNMQLTALKKNAEFNYGMLEEERSRLTSVMKDYGFYKFSNDNITFILDTLNKQYFKDLENPFESAINFIALQKKHKKPTLDIKVIIRAEEDPAAYYRYAIHRVRVFPNFIGRADYRDSTMIQKTVSGVVFRYRPEDYYIRENVIVKHLFIEPETYFSQSNYDQTISKLNELGVFQTVRITFVEDTSRGGHWLNCNIYLNPGKKFDYNTTLEGSNGTTYAVGSALTLTLRNRNVAKGANLLTTTLSGGVELRYNDTLGNNFFKDFAIQTRNLGINSNIEFPKFLVPFKNDFSRRNSPRTVVGAGISLLERVGYFTLINTSASLTYKWRETSTKNWEFSPAFANIIRTPYISDSFQKRLNENSFLRNTYKETFIEGENIAWIFSDREKRHGRNYSYVRLGFEEAGIIAKGVNSGISKIDKAYTELTNYAQYLKFDFDLQHFFPQRHSTLATRFYGGIGAPYDNSKTLPYIKQYFVGGPYSIRGYRIRRLGPGSYYDTSQSTATVIDRTGDIKLEMNVEYRFDMVNLFSGAIGLKGAVFADAGNIWLYNDAPEFPGGKFKFSNLATDIAISTGVGIRFDVAGFFLVRVDMGMPVKNPDYPDYALRIPNVNRGWVWDKIAFGDSGWRKQNLVFGFAIGYPF
jgi:outer membrane protein insertion porin family